jgi:hypothetical protein
MSGGELPNYISMFNTDDYETLNNCYTYALSVWKNPITGDNDNGKLIFSPSEANRGSNSIFLGYFTLKPPPTDMLINE